MPDLDHLLARLIRANVDFVVVGGYAAFAYGADRGTIEIGVCCDFSEPNLKRLQAALTDLNPVHRMHPGRPPLELTPDTARGWKNLYLDTDLGQLDCLSELLAVGGYQEARESSIEIALPAGPCRILSLDALIRSKEAMGRPRDREAVLQLRAIRERLAAGADAPDAQGEP